MKRWEELPDVPGWERDLTLPTFAVYRRVFDKAVVLVCLNIERDIVNFGPDYWTISGVVFSGANRSGSMINYGDYCPFEWAEERFGGKDS